MKKTYKLLLHRAHQRLTRVDVQNIRNNNFYGVLFPEIKE